MSRSQADWQWAGRPPVEPSVVDAALSDAEAVPFWLDRDDRPTPRPALDGDLDCDLAVVGGGYSGLWAALLAKERDPDRDVVLLEADRIGGAASGRNGGFCSASLTHGDANGMGRWPDEMPRLRALGQANLDAIEAAVERYGIDCGFARTGEITVATEAHHVGELRDLAASHPAAMTLLDAEAVQALVCSPTYRAGVLEPEGTALVDPARLAWGLADAAEGLGVRIVEGTAVQGIDRSPLALRTATGRVRARQVALGTNAFPALMPKVRFHTVPVWDHVVVTEPLDAGRRAALGWEGRQGISDAGNRFHYYRLTDDDRLLWGGFDALYHFGGRMRPEHEHSDATSRALVAHLLATFPALEGVRITHRWGGAIDTCTRFCAFFATSHGGNVACSAGYTGLGVGATRFGAEVVLDLLAGEPTERTELEMVRRRPLPFPPEPLAWAGISLTRRSLARSDARGGRRDLWLRTLDRLGLGFDS